MKDPVANSFITQLLNKLPELRLGGSYTSLKKHAFLAPIEWVIIIFIIGSTFTTKSRSCLFDSSRQTYRSIKTDLKGQKLEFRAVSTCRQNNSKKGFKF